MWGPPSPSNTLILEIAPGWMVCIGIAKGGNIAATKDGVGGGKHKSTLSPHNWKDNVPTCTAITIFAVAINGLPGIMGSRELSFLCL